MTIASVNPVNGETVSTYRAFDSGRIEAALAAASHAAPEWSRLGFAGRAGLLRRAAEILRARSQAFAGLITLEMGKLAREARAEVEKCAWACEYYAEHAATLLRDEPVPTEARHSLVACQPLGTVLAVMPWNFPFWQVVRFAAPALMAGNTCLLKHASNVPQCALAIEEWLGEAGLPGGVFQTLLIGAGAVEGLIADRRVHAVTLTGSGPAGRRVAAAAGQHLKKSVLELGGSDPFIVLDDADLDATVAGAVTGRFQNAGQSCIAAKRFLVTAGIAEAFTARLSEAARGLAFGDPNDPDATLAPMARADLRDEVHAQVEDARAKGAKVLAGGARPEGPGAFYPATVLTGVTPAMRVWSEEVFGPVATVIPVRDADEALRLANDTEFGLGGSVWTRDLARGEALARRLQCGAAFVNGMVKSDPRLPFGGVKASGYGRELGAAGIREFVNVKSLVIA